MEGKKLTLSKETLRTLDDAELTGVVGGQPTGGVVCVNTVICQSGICNNDSTVCNSVACDSVLCNVESVVCHSGVCGSVACNSVAICG